jgi:hypothetical protein
MATQAWANCFLDEREVASEATPIARGHACDLIFEKGGGASHYPRGWGEPGLGGGRPPSVESTVQPRVVRSHVRTGMPKHRPGKRLVPLLNEA